MPGGYVLGGFAPVENVLGGYVLGGYVLGGYVPVENVLGGYVLGGYAGVPNVGGGAW